MIIRLCLLAVLAVGINAQYNVRRRDVSYSNKPQRGRRDPEILLAFVMFRHGDRTPSTDELKIFPTMHFNSSLFFPYGIKSLTNRGKQKSYQIGQYLRERYTGFLSDYYLSKEITVRSTDFARTKMSVLAALAGLFPPNQAQKWNSQINWQPIPYDTRPLTDDDMSIYASCPSFVSSKIKVYDFPEIKKQLQDSEEFFQNVSKHARYRFRTLLDVYFLNNAVNALQNVGVKLPKWLKEVTPKIIELTNLHFETSFYTTQLKSLAGGVVLGDFVSASNAIIAGDKAQPKVHLLSGHETAVSAFMAAVNVFSKPHQPKYGATFSLELYRTKNSKTYKVMAVYSAEPGAPGVPLPIPNCGGQNLCDFEKFITLTKDIFVTRNEHKARCASTSA